LFTFDSLLVLLVTVILYFSYLSALEGKRGC
jgi:hypothetical protein